jgi:hypothetical protein
MPVIDIPDPLLPAITPDREVIEFLIGRHLDEFGANSLVARTWHWVLHGGGRAPISHTDWSQFDGDGPPSAATLAAESTASEPPSTRPLPGTSSTGPGSSAGCAPPGPKTNCRCASTPGTPRPRPPPPKKARSPSPCARFPATDRRRHRLPMPLSRGTPGCGSRPRVRAFKIILLSASRTPSARRPP